MADNTANSDWVDCNALRRAEEAGGDGQRDGLGDSLNDNAWRPRLRLIDPESEAAGKAERKAREEAEARAAAEAKAKAEKAAQEKAVKEAAAEQAAREQAEKEEAERHAKAEAEAKAAAEEESRKQAEAEEAKNAAERKKREEAEAKRFAEEQARIEAERKAEEEAKAKAEAERKAEEEAEARAAAEQKAREEAEALARAKAAKKKAEAEAKAKAEAEETKRKEAEAEKLAKLDLGKTFRRLIRENGPISLAQFMGESNARYYATRNPLGDDSEEGGDFITSPEISQMFGELIGLWIADLWVKMGASDNIHYVELGPGRGTLARDILKTAGKYGFKPHVHFVEGSLELRKIQRYTVPQVHFHHDLSTLPEDRPLLIVANEFFDALPIHQLVRSANGWRERMVGLEGDDFAFVAGDKPMDAIVPESWKDAGQGTMIETSPAAATVMAEIAQRLTNQGGVALIIDYGARELSAGSTLQALKAHKKVDPLKHPGEADLTAHVDFEMLQQVAEKNGAEVMGLQTQGDWLRHLHIDTRLEALKRKSPKMAETLQRQRDRLVEHDQMGELFKVLGICGRRWPIGEGFG